MLNPKTSGTPGRENMGRAVPAATVSRLTASWSVQPGGTWFGPGLPLPAQVPEVAGRQFDFPVNYNTSIRPRSYEQLSFEQLRAFADPASGGFDLLRLAIETRKDQIESYTWNIQAVKGEEVPEATIKAARAIFKYPDREHPWNTWLRMLVEDILVIDAAVIYPRPTRGGGLYSLDLMAGDTIRRLLDPSGRTPLPPDPAYQQALKGVPAVDYTREELVYWMRNPRTNRVYGLSPVEQVVMTVNIALRRQLHQLSYYTEGNMPEALLGVPDTWGVETTKQWQLYWDTMLQGDLAERRRMRFVPFDPTKAHYPKADAMKDQFDEWLARIICFCFSISPTALVKETNRATADSVQDAAKKEGLVPLLNWLKQLLDFLLQEKCGFQGLEFSWEIQKDLDPLVQAQVDKIYIEAQVYGADEVRKRLGIPDRTPEQEAELEAKRQAAQAMAQAAAANAANAGKPATEDKPGKDAPKPGAQDEAPTDEASK